MKYQCRNHGYYKSCKNCSLGQPHLSNNQVCPEPEPNPNIAYHPAEIRDLMLDGLTESQRNEIVSVIVGTSNVHDLSVSWNLQGRMLHNMGFSVEELDLFWKDNPNAPTIATQTDIIHFWYWERAVWAKAVFEKEIKNFINGLLAVSMISSAWQGTRRDNKCIECETRDQGRKLTCELVIDRENKKEITILVRHWAGDPSVCDEFSIGNTGLAKESITNYLTEGVNAYNGVSSKMEVSKND